jgi:uncharacterized membrane protein YgaE (UPF0421/DUF939 family)
MYVRLAVLTALAAVAAYVIAEAVPFADPIPAAITAVIATRATFHHAAKETVFQVLGALLGGAIALGEVFVIGSSAVVIFLLVLLCFVLPSFVVALGENGARAAYLSSRLAQRGAVASPHLTHSTTG